MSDLSRAVLHAVSEAGLILSAPVLVINDFNRELERELPGADFWNPEQELVPPDRKYKSVLLFSPKQKDENRYLTALSLQMLKPGGVMACAAENEAGGKTLAKILKDFGVAVTDHSKHKCRVAWTVEPQKAAANLLEQAIEKGKFQQRGDGLWSLPGLFSWDRLDKGTDILLHHLPFSISGLGADFGCGIGILGLKMLQRYKGVEKLYCLDKDIRALECCSRNLAAFPQKFETRLADLNQAADLPKLDFIIMNPPFHIGKKQSAALGQSFIRNAGAALKTGGMLVFVANTHLPYEAEIAKGFGFHRVLSEENGFKIIEALK